MTNLVYIQVRDIAGEWFTTTTTLNQPQLLNVALDNAVKQFRKQARAVDAVSGNMIDFRLPLDIEKKKR